MNGRPSPTISAAAVPSAGRLAICFVVESGTDARLVDGLAQMSDVTVLARRVVGGIEINQRPKGAARLEIGSGSLFGFARDVFKTLRSRGRRFDFVLVQGHSVAAAAANLAARITGVPSAMLICSPAEAYYQCRKLGDSPGKPFRRRELLGIRVLARLNAIAGSRYVVLSRYLQGVVEGHGGRLPVHVIPVYGVDTAVFHPSLLPRTELRRHRGLPASGQVIFFSSRVAPEKDAATLLAAFVLLHNQGRDIHLLHRSGGFRAFAAEAARAGVGDRVIATDAVHPLDELPLDYAASDLCVQASRAEGLGFSVLEALACGTPVVASAVGGLAETIVDGVTGWTYPPGDAAALARRIAEALDDPGEAQRRAQAGRAMVLERYQRDDAFAALERVIAGATS